MKRTSLNILMILVLILLLFTSCAKPEKLQPPNVGEKKGETKVDKFIEDITESMENRETLDFIKKIESYNLSDDEFIEIQKKLAEGLDEKYFNGEINLYKSDKYSNRFNILYSLNVYNCNHWKKNYTYEEIVIEKIVPLIDSDSDILKAIWLPSLTILLMDIHNQKLPFSDENRTSTMDLLVNIITNKENHLEIKNSAFEAWIFCEQREEKVYEVFNKTMMDEELFSLIGIPFWFLTGTAPKIYDMMLNILENKNKYSEKQIIGALDFFRHDKGMKAGDRIERLHESLIKIRDSENRIHKKEKIKIILKCLETRKKKENGK